jgi:hypothetical protein
MLPLKIRSGTQHHVVWWIGRCVWGRGGLLLLCAGIYLCTNYTAKSHVHGFGAFKNYVLKEVFRREMGKLSKSRKLNIA